MSSYAFTAPHHQAAAIGQQLLADGASAIDAMVAAAAAIAVVYPHMNSLGGDGFWLIQAPGQAPVGIDACGFSAAAADRDWYLQQSLSSIPTRGADAAICQAGTLDGWRVAREWAVANNMAQRELIELLAPAAQLARDGIVTTQSLQMASDKLAAENCQDPSYLALYQPQGRPLREGDKLHNPGLADFLEIIAKDGTETFYRGDVGAHIAAHLQSVGSPLRETDFLDYRAQQVKPLSTRLRDAEIYNLPPPTQGIASLIILAVYDRLCAQKPPASEAERVHCLVEATKQAFMIRDREVRDPEHLSPQFNALLNPDSLDRLAAEIQRDRALAWPHSAEHGDTVWMGALDQYGVMVSFIQSVYWEFGSAVVIPQFGLIWNNRGMSFQLDPNHSNALAPRRKPFHTLNPAFAVFNNGDRLSYGTMGGEGQPQTQAALFSRFSFDTHSLNDAISRPRWLLGRTWGSQDNDLKLEQGLYTEIGDALQSMGHVVAPVADESEMMGHAGAVCLYSTGTVDAATDPRSDGAALIGARE